MNNPKATKDGVKIVLKNDVADEVEKITETNPRSQTNGKKLCLMFLSVLLECLPLF